MRFSLHYYRHVGACFVWHVTHKYRTPRNCNFLQAATAHWSINAVSSSSTSPHKTIEHGSIESNKLTMTLIILMTQYDSV